MPRALSLHQEGRVKNDSEEQEFDAFVVHSEYCTFQNHSSSMIPPCSTAVVHAVDNGPAVRYPK